MCVVVCRVGVCCVLGVSRVECSVDVSWCGEV